MTEILSIQDQQAAAAFDRQSGEFDLLYGNDPIVRYKRDRVRQHLEQWLRPGASILELNAGTGEDACYLASKGYRVHATDVSPGMLSIMNEKLEALSVKDNVSTEHCSFATLGRLRNKGPYDHIFSNFAGLNCSGQLDRVLKSFDPLLAPGGRITLVILPRFCLWEFLLLFRGKFRTAFRRFAGRRGAPAKINDKQFRCWYYNPSYVKKALGPGYDMLSLEGLCSLVPPSYLQGFPEKKPGLFQKLVRLEERLRFSRPWRSVGDYYIVSFGKVQKINGTEFGRGD